mmetsp:Transcript_8125/g.19972  ORF Transcript_8125/g.19972 Transcript_8125/m.19972 type:complete len:416 (+) Transcript_8125:118-1365(+)|eukprot:CAMPEP_0116081848 /NCGR_PEP_ID=MMETSP0327-20121206/2416_1 /TAXON_ID=44447 /ORGANISM="Pseudo-nitzschia delicatissima, Strain B596" /LENGTH=415 /DNA_ID=CAMNT_0003572611 /DNA_START=78 /DNA_END=1325 /DNA_ORIENTATION=-
MFAAAFESIVCCWATALFLFAANTAIAEEAVAAHEYIEPEVHRYTNVLPKEVCDKIIALGEAAGFPLEMDSIDSLQYKDSQNNHSQAIDVVDEDGTVRYPEIFEELKPFIPKLAKLIRSQRNEKLDRILFPDEPPDRLPELHWVFYRKYSPDSPRNSLVPHTDTNMHTVNIALNDDFTGGGLFYLKPPRPSNPDYYPNENNNYFSQGDLDPVVDLQDHQYSYHYVNRLRHENTSNVVFPKLETGDALIHNFTVWHAVAPLEAGTRYSMVMFFDMHNPCLIDYGADNEDHEDEHEDEDYFDITVRHNIRECDTTTGKLVSIPYNLDLYWVDPDDELEPLRLVQSKIVPGAIFEGMSSAGHEFRALRSLRDGEDPPPLHSREILASIVIESGQEDYEFVGTTQNECDAMNSAEKNEL